MDGSSSEGGRFDIWWWSIDKNKNIGRGSKIYYKPEPLLVETMFRSEQTTTVREIEVIHSLTILNLAGLQLLLKCCTTSKNLGAFIRNVDANFFSLLNIFFPISHAKNRYRDKTKISNHIFLSKTKSVKLTEMELQPQFCNISTVERAITLTLLKRFKNAPFCVVFKKKIY